MEDGREGTYRVTVGWTEEDIVGIGGGLGKDWTMILEVKFKVLGLVGLPRAEEVQPSIPSTGSNGSSTGSTGSFLS